MKQYLEVGKIVNTHGIKGEMKLLLWCDSIDFLKKAKHLYLDSDGVVEVKLTSCRSHKNDALVVLDCVSSFEEAEKMKNRVLYINRNDVEVDDGCYFIQDLLGCEVKNIENGDVIGVVDDVTNLGASDIYSVKNSMGQLYLIPVIKDIVKEINTEKKEIHIKVMKGLLDDED